MIESLLGSRTKVKILRTLLQHDREIWFSDMSKLTGISTGALHPALTNLVNFHIVKTRKAGRSILYSLNKSHFLYGYIKDLFEAENKIPLIVAKEFVRKLNKHGIMSIILFGSLARGEFTEKSDIDMLIVYNGQKDNIRQDVYKTTEFIMGKYDIVISAVYITEKEAKKRLEKLEGFMVKVSNEGVVLYGGSKWLKK